MHLRSQGAGCARDSLAGNYPAANTSAPRGPAVEGGTRPIVPPHASSVHLRWPPTSPPRTRRPGNLGLDVLEPLPKPRRTFAPFSSAVRPTTSGLNQGEIRRRQPVPKPAGDTTDSALIIDDRSQARDLSLDLFRHRADRVFRPGSRGLRACRSNPIWKPGSKTGRT
jgi:hypothetical protein